MKRAPALAFAAAVALASASSPEEADAGPPAVSLSASPGRIAVTAPGSRTIEIRNAGRTPVQLDVVPAAVRGERATVGWVRVAPARLSLRPRGRAVVTLRVRAPRHAEPGDHHLLVLLTTRAPRRARIAVRMRLGVLVRVRAPGRVVRRLQPGPLRVRRTRRVRVLALVVANRGNVTEPLRGRVEVTLVHRGRVIARLRPQRPAEVLPRRRAVVVLRYAGRVRGRVVAVVRIRPGRGLGAAERRYVLRL